MKCYYRDYDEQLIEGDLDIDKQDMLAFYTEKYSLGCKVIKVRITKDWIIVEGRKFVRQDQRKNPVYQCCQYDFYVGEKS